MTRKQFLVGDCDRTEDGELVCPEADVPEFTDATVPEKRLDRPDETVRQKRVRPPRDADVV